MYLEMGRQNLLKRESYGKWKSHLGRGEKCILKRQRELGGGNREASERGTCRILPED